MRAQRTKEKWLRGLKQSRHILRGSNFYMDLMKEKFQSLLTLFLVIKMYMSMKTLVHKYENEDEYIEDMFRQEEQFISYSDRSIEIWKLKI